MYMFYSLVALMLAPMMVNAKDNPLGGEKVFAVPYVRGQNWQGIVAVNDNSGQKTQEIPQDLKPEEKESIVFEFMLENGPAYVLDYNNKKFKVLRDGKMLQLVAILPETDDDYANFLQQIGV